MPNWVYGRYAIKGTAKNVLAFLNEGIRNSGYEPKKSCKAAYDFLKKNAKTKESEGAGTCATAPASIVYRKGLSLDTFRQKPDTFCLYDTTNRADRMPEIASEQKRLYGCVGWYDWGLKYRGTKWNAEMEDFSLSEDEGTATLTFKCDTAWSYPDEWLRWVEEKFDVTVLLCVNEESGAFCFYGVLDGEQLGMDRPGEPVESDYESEDDYYDALSEYNDECISSMQSSFDDFVSEYEP